MSSLGPIADLISPYMDRPKLSGSENLASRCPFPDHDDHSPSFAVNINNGLWKCHGCNRSGNLVTLLRGLGVSRSRVDQLVGPLIPQIHKRQRREQQRKQSRFLGSDPFLAEVIIPESVLGVFDWRPDGLVEQGFEPILLRELEIGYDRESDRITFPIRDTYGNLVGISGRSTFHDVKPRYLVYRGRRKTDKGFVAGDFGPGFDDLFPTYQIKIHKYLWNAHRAYQLLETSNEPVIVVEGFKGCIWMLQHGYWNTVATMGSSMSQEQYDLICRVSGSGVTLMFDNDRAGIKGTQQVGKWLSRSVANVTVCELPVWAQQPDDLNAKGLKEALESRKRFEKWMRERQTTSLA